MTIFTKTLGDKGKLVPVLTETNELEKGLAVPGHTVNTSDLNVSCSCLYVQCTLYCT